GTVSGATVTLFADGNPIGAAVASGSTTTVTTNGSATLLDGVHQITAAQTETGTSSSAISGALSITIDTAGPVAANSSFAFETSHALVFQFNEDVSASLGASDATILNTSTNQTYSPSSVSWNASTNAATFIISPRLPDANYTATLLGS